MSEAFILIHSPLVGPMTWMPVAERLSQLGHRAIVPSLIDSLQVKSGFAEAFADRVAANVADSRVKGPVHLVAHSGAGFYMPAFQKALDHPVADYLFIDARLPKGGASLFDESPDVEVERLSAMAEDGWLPPWSEWFGEDAIMEALPDRTIRERFLAELSSIPLVMLEEETAPLNGWPDAPCGYLCLSAPYLPEANAAEARGWIVREVQSGHLHMLVDPIATVRLLLELRDLVEDRRGRID